jgi:2,3,4,5-tetrahydropyridine-2-carboxylate N-succinyltransferase
VVNDWVKKAVLLSFRIEDNQFIKGGFTNYYDKVPPSTPTPTPASSATAACAWCRRRPPARFLHRPELRADALLRQHRRLRRLGTMVDTWATVGSCAQIGKNVHLSGGVGIGGVLEPVQAHRPSSKTTASSAPAPRSSKGVIVEPGRGDLDGRLHRPEHQDLQPRDRRDRLRSRPPGAVVVPGNLPSEDGSHSLYCAVIIKQVDEKTRGKVGLNELLRDI